MDVATHWSGSKVIFDWSNLMLQLLSLRAVYRAIKLSSPVSPFEKYSPL